MFSLFLVHTTQRRPVILVPGTYASQLQIKLDNYDTYWYCPKTMDWTTVWVDEKFFIPPKYNCMFKWFLSQYNEEYQNVTTMPGVEFDTVDFGGLRGVTMIDNFSTINTSFIPYYYNLVKKLEQNNFIEGESLFGAPNDWRYGIAGQPSTLYPRLKELCEKAFYINKAKVVLVGHSFGGFCVHYFLDAMEQSWVDKYIDHAVLLSPSFTGSGETLYISWERSIKKIIELNMTGLRNLIENVGAVHTHFPNYELFDGEPVLYRPNGQPVYPNEFISFLREQGRLSEANEKIARLQEKYISKFPPAPKVRTVIVYNSALNTTGSISLNSYNEGDKFTHNYIGGDGTIPAPAIQKVCKKYPELECNDLNSTKDASHFMMLMNPDLIDYFYRLIRD